MTIFNALPDTLTNGTTADATQVMANFNQLVSNGNANAAHNGANSDITALSGLTTPISGAQGGTLLFIGGTSTGSANAHVVATTNPTTFTLTIGNRLTFVAGFTNTGATTLNGNSTGVTNVLKRTITGLLALSGNEIIAGQAYTVMYDGTQFEILDNVFDPSYLRGFLDGFDTGAPGGGITLTIGQGAAIDNSNLTLLKVTTSFTKTTASWAVGSGNGALDTGSSGGSASTPYFLYIIQRPDTGVTDYLISLSSSTPTMPASYTIVRGPIAWLKLDGAKNILQYQQRGDDFVYGVMVHDVALATTFGTSAALSTLTVPLGFPVTVRIRATVADIAGTGVAAIFTSPDETDQAPAVVGGPSDINASVNATVGVTLLIRTNTSGQIRQRSSVAAEKLDIYTYGFNWSRGRNS